MFRICVILTIVFACLCVADVAVAADPVNEPVAGARGVGRGVRGLGVRRRGGVRNRGRRGGNVGAILRLLRRGGGVRNLAHVRGGLYGVGVSALDLYDIGALDVGHCGCDGVAVRRALIRSLRY